MSEDSGVEKVEKKELRPEVEGEREKKKVSPESLSGPPRFGETKTIQGFDAAVKEIPDILHGDLRTLYDSVMRAWRDAPASEAPIHHFRGQEFYESAIVKLGEKIERAPSVKVEARKAAKHVAYSAAADMLEDNAKVLENALKAIDEWSVRLDRAADVLTRIQKVWEFATTVNDGGRTAVALAAVRDARSKIADRKVLVRTEIQKIHLQAAEARDSAVPKLRRRHDLHKGIHESRVASAALVRAGEEDYAGASRAIQALVDGQWTSYFRELISFQTKEDQSRVYVQTISSVIEGVTKFAQTFIPPPWDVFMEVANVCRGVVGDIIDGRLVEGLMKKAEEGQLSREWVKGLDKDPTLMAQIQGAVFNRRVAIIADRVLSPMMAAGGFTKVSAPVISFVKKFAEEWWNEKISLMMQESKSVDVEGAFPIKVSDFEEEFLTSANYGKTLGILAEGGSVASAWAEKLPNVLIRPLARELVKRLPVTAAQIVTGKDLTLVLQAEEKAVSVSGVPSIPDEPPEEKSISLERQVILTGFLEAHQGWDVARMDYTGIDERTKESVIVENRITFNVPTMGVRISVTAKQTKKRKAEKEGEAALAEFPDFSDIRIYPVTAPNWANCVLAMEGYTDYSSGSTTGTQGKWYRTQDPNTFVLIHASSGRMDFIKGAIKTRTGQSAHEILSPQGLPLREFL
ncbi:hypothetical protein [Streptomyces sp. NPDC048419]|uniref:hypothetical protein n=1 Tax=Streptomyces sp. NPDC048419 TaxID=3365547 RepID=UPI00371A2B1E